jgi:hypothetical protein
MFVMLISLAGTLPSKPMLSVEPMLPALGLANQTGRPGIKTQTKTKTTTL